MTQSTIAIVGSGIVGTTIAYLLTQKGYDVDIFEKGPEYPYPHRTQFEEEIAYVYENPAYRLPPDLKDITRSSDLKHNLNGDFYAVEGGSSTRWSAITLRMIPSDFKTKTLYGYGEDWPITYDDIEAYYSKAEEFLGVSGTDADNPFAPRRSKPYPLPPFELSYQDQIFAEKLKAKGIILHSTPQARTRLKYGDRPACDNYGPCQVCPNGARYSPNYHLQLAKKTGKCKVHANVTVRRIITDKSGRATGIVYQQNNQAKQKEHAAKVVIIAANAIESPRLLLLSKNEQHPNGIGNNSGHVGKHLSFHHGWHGELRYKKPTYPARFGGWTGQSHQFLDPPTRKKHGGIKIEFPFINAPDEFLFASPEKWKTAADVLANFEDIKHWHGIRFHSEVSVGPGKYVTLSKKRDRFGDPFAHVEYKTDERDYETYKFASQLFKKIASATDAEQTKFFQFQEFTTTAHHHGTCRMGKDLKSSVVDQYGKVHGISNLFVAGGSSFVGSAAVNPTLTMVALAMRTADYIRDQVLS
ncbi:MAG: GMC family oxidoreductase [Calothrix sp. MO_167.B12]|nr:GMC family oxidoreductase [Calothrix sp. MO_167.B12]